MGYIRLFALFTAVAAILCATAIYASMGEVVVEALPSFIELDGEMVSVSKLAKGKDVREYREKNKLVIRKAGGEYIWASNGNKPLAEVVRTFQNEDGRETVVSVFINPNGDGIVFVKHIPLDKNGCARIMPNYREYRSGLFGLREISGSTTPYPYPNPMKENCYIRGY